MRPSPSIGGWLSDGRPDQNISLFKIDPRCFMNNAENFGSFSITSPASVLDRCDRRVGRNRPRISHKRGRFRQDPLERAFVIEEFIQPTPDRRFHVVGTAIAHVSVLIPGL